MSVIENRDNRGGARLGAGRRKGTKNANTQGALKFKNYFIEQASLHKKEIIDELMKKARQGNLYAISEVLDRVLGKPGDTLDLNLGNIKELQGFIGEILKK